MATAHDIAAAILEQTGQITTMKLQKLLYYTQAWSLAWYGERAFGETIRAYNDGPVVGVVFNDHRRMLSVKALPSGDASRVQQRELATIREVIRVYNCYSGDDLSSLTHRERPWLSAHVPNMQPSPVISAESMRDYYRSAAIHGPGVIPEEYVEGAELLLSLDEPAAIALHDLTPAEYSLDDLEQMSTTHSS